MKNKILRLMIEIKYPTSYDYKNLSEFMNKIKHPFVSSELKIIDKNQGLKDITNQTFYETSYIVKYSGTDNICNLLNKIHLFDDKIKE